MRITQDDVGRKVLLRNGDTATITEWHQHYKEWTVKLNNDNWHGRYGNYEAGRETKYDIVSFADEAQPTSDKVTPQEIFTYLLDKIVECDDAEERCLLRHLVLLLT